MTLVLFIFVNLVFFCPKMILWIKIEISRNVFYNSLGFYFHNNAFLSVKIPWHENLKDSIIYVYRMCIYIIYSYVYRHTYIDIHIYIYITESFRFSCHGIFASYLKKPSLNNFECIRSFR